ncbi:MAG: DUF262 domain-containing protein [Lentisphaerae bacterium]|nr:DUF262 domain-containing protein [Lentisphaerota bacterium]
MSSKMVTFWEYLQNNRIQIPIIQRDYAQGRKGKSALRRRFLQSLYEALAEDKTLKLDFVYGVIQNNTSLPLDGQQRLTTLWLLHWFAAYKAGKLAEAQKTLEKFSYETRISSRKFCKKLCGFSQRGDKDKTIAAIIEEQTWFYSAWKQDPTISAMLCMISGEEGQNADCLEKVFFNFDNLWEKLIDADRCPIRFYTMNIGEMQLTDDLYIKMNARGEPLTPCENFKADLFEYIREKAEKDETWNAFLDPVNGIIQKWDNSWTDIFWKQKCSSNSRKWRNRIDEIFFAFINRFWLNYMIENGLTEKEIEDIHYYNKELEYNSFTDYASANIDNSSKKFNIKKALDSLQKILDRYSEVTQKQQTLSAAPLWESSAKHSFIPQYKSLTDESNEYPIEPTTQPGRVIFYAICKFLEYNEFQEVFLDKYQKWMRVVWNIVGDGSAINTIESMRSAIKLIGELAPNSGNIIEFLANNNNTVRSDFASDQMKEERRKALMIKKQSNAESIIRDIEKNKYFKGRIISLMLGDDAISADKLNTRFIRFNTFLTEKKPSDLGRKLLQYGDYRIRPQSKGNNWRFVSSEKSLYEMLHDRGEDFYSRFIPIFVKFVDEIKPEWKYTVANWEYYFIRYKGILNKSDNGLFAWDSDFSCRLLTKSDIKGGNCSPYIAAIEDPPCNMDMWSNSRNAYRGFTRLNESNQEIKLQEQNGKVYLLIKSTDDKSALISIEWQKNNDLVDFLKTEIENQFKKN